MNCEATLTVCVTTDDVVASLITHDEPHIWFDVNETLPDGVAVVRDGDRLLRLDVTTLTCDGGTGCFVDTLGNACHDSDSDGDSQTPSAQWMDDTPGAASHDTPPADVCATCQGQRRLVDFIDHGPCPDCTPPADVCPDCGTALVDDPIEGFPPHVTCPKCGGTGDRPAVTDAEPIDGWVMCDGYVMRAPHCGGHGLALGNCGEDCPPCRVTHRRLYAELEAAAARQEQ